MSTVRLIHTVPPSRNNTYSTGPRSSIKKKSTLGGLNFPLSIWAHKTDLCSRRSSGRRSSRDNVPETKHAPQPRRQEHRRLPTDVNSHRVARTQQREIGRVYLGRLFQCDRTSDGWNAHMQLELFSLLGYSVASRKRGLIRSDKTKRTRTRYGSAIK